MPAAHADPHHDHVRGRGYDFAEHCAPLDSREPAARAGRIRCPSRVRGAGCGRNARRGGRWSARDSCFASRHRPTRIRLSSSHLPSQVWVSCRGRQWAATAALAPTASDYTPRDWARPGQNTTCSQGRSPIQWMEGNVRGDWSLNIISRWDKLRQQVMISIELLRRDQRGKDVIKKRRNKIMQHPWCGSAMTAAVSHLTQGVMWSWDREMGAGDTRCAAYLGLLFLR